jgi:hypothetical protein
MDEQSDKPSQSPHSFEADLLGAFLGFHKRVMALLRVANLGDENVRLVGERIHLLMDKATKNIEQTRDLNVQPHLDSMFEEVKRMVEELSEREPPRESPRPR